MDIQRGFRVNSSPSQTNSTALPPRERVTVASVLLRGALL
jgi:hypothetical protein